ncbi:TIGR01459 family HAD-type hydrolase [Acetobacter thailandicus]|uniref:TIGR01459 family HAD-type hydrolase n=1 Tax=Acetobacter thailandicus TaxID=1502842 RepID=A0ABT3QH78_9PROT|nr:TIGR01459 family HAD-type hydrolase [Acetobacter thailandicus]MCX2564646.1 TIGR01459 family HAD-type hydrolase [Acetobacter thailandicus]NHN95888.1 TIGR01459 family HAD-type hydrolase [Acetobacter thailandicus]
MTGISSVADRYNGYVVDLWGTVHDGVQTYPGVIACLEALRAAGKRIVLLSNAPRPADVVHQQLQKFGVCASLYDGIVTSGEVARSLLRERTDPWCARLGRKVLHLGGLHDLGLYDGLNLEQVSDVEEADFILNAGPDIERGVEAIDPYLPELRAALTRGLPMLCANPDMTVIKGGQRMICAGALALFYEQEGGNVRWVGKPYAEVYDPVFELLNVPKERILAVGDALATDIRGATVAGIDGAWILGGIHQELLDAGDERVAEIARAAGLAPAITLKRFTW